MAEQLTKMQKFKRFVKRNATPTWAKRFSYQVISFLLSIALVAGVITYAFNKSYVERKLYLVKGFTITAHSGAFNTPDNSMDYIDKAIEQKVDILEIDVRQRPDGTLVMGHDIVITNKDGVEVEEVFKKVKDTGILINLDIKEVRTLKTLRELVEKYDLLETVFLTGINILEVDAVKKDFPQVAYYLNYSPSRIKIFTEDYQTKLLKLLDDTGAIGINCSYQYASQTLSEVLHKNGYKLSVWTVDQKRHMIRTLSIHPDNITTHNVAELNQLIDNWKK